MTIDPERLPVLISGAQLTLRKQEPMTAMAPLTMLEHVAREAAAESERPGVLGSLDTVATIAGGGWAEPDPGAALAGVLGIKPAKTLVAGGGGESGVLLINHLAARITRGESRAALLASTHNMRTAELAHRRGIDVSWPTVTSVEPERLGVVKAGNSRLENDAGLQRPIHLYPLFENALRASRGQTLDEHRRMMGALFARFTETAAANPHAWFPVARSAEELTTVTPDNRMICFPYPKLVNAILSTDQAAALILVSAAEARRLGVPEDRWVYWWGGHAAQEEAWYVSTRPDFANCPAMADSHVVALRNAGCGVDDIAHIDFYSCFPAPVEMACKVLGLALDDRRGFTVTGGLPYAGGPGSAYTVMSLAAMAARLRTDPGALGLVTGNGWYLTKHSASVWSTRPPQRVTPGNASPAPDALPSATMPTAPLEPQAGVGVGRVEAYTVIHDHVGAPVRGVVIGRRNDETRFVANTDADPAFLAEFEHREQVGTEGKLSVVDGHLHFDPV